jgi:hypothetical protein
MAGAITATKDSIKQFKALTDHAAAKGQIFPTRNVECCMQYVAVLARDYDSEDCTPAILDFALEWSLGRC